MKNQNKLFDMPRLVTGTHPPDFGYDADIIILMQERLSETIDAVDSALRQQNITVHVSVLDQGSSKPVQLAFAERFKDQAHFGYYAADRNLGVAGGRNFLSALGSGKMIVGLDNDAVFADDLVVVRAAALFEGSPALGAIGFKILARDGITIDEFSWGYPQGLKNAAHGTFASTTFVGAGHAIRRRTWVAAGGYDAALFFTWEEYDFALRAIALHWTILYAGSLAVIHKISPEARVGWQSERMRLFVRNRLLIARKWNVSWLALLPRICLYLLRAMRNRRLLQALSGIFETLRMDRSVFKKEMTPHMRLYVHVYETRFHRDVFHSLYSRAVRKLQAGAAGLSESGRFHRHAKARLVAQPGQARLPVVQPIALSPPASPPPAIRQMEHF